MCGYGSLRHRTSGGLSPSGKVASLLIRNPWVVLDLSSSMVKITGKRGTLGSSYVAANLAMVLHVRCTGARVGAGWKVGLPQTCVGTVGKTWRACVGNHLSGAA